MFKVFGKVAIGGALVALGVSAAAFSADWPQYLGPQRDGVVHDAKGLARTWPEGGPKQLWETAVGKGYGGAAIYGDSVLLLDREEDARDALRKFSFATGKEVWKYSYDAPTSAEKEDKSWRNHPGGRSAPATDGKTVFSIGPLGDMVAVKFSDGSLVWKANLLTDWGATRPQWVVSTSPLLYGDWVIVTPWGKKAAVVAYEKTTGKPVWTTQSAKGLPMDYQSPVPMTLGGRDIILAMGRQGYLIGVDAKTGKELFNYDGFPKKGWSIPSPVVIGDGRIFLTSGYKSGSAMIKVEAEGDGFKVTELWKNMNLGSKCAQALLWNGFLYGNSSDVGGGLRCLTLDGEVKWDSKASNKQEFNLGNLIIADGLIYVIHGGNGNLFMAEATPDGYKQLGVAPELSGKDEPWAPLAFKDGKLVIRDRHKMICLDVTAAK